MTTLVKAGPINLLSFGYDAQAVQLIKDNIAKEASDQELALFLTQCQRTQLDPFARQIYCIGRWDSRLRRQVFTTQISIDGARLVAERSNKYEGQDGPHWCGEDGVWRDVWLCPEPPSAARVGVFKTGFKQPLYAVANWDSYAQTNKEGQLTSMWAKFPALMLGKVAEMLALRRAFPMELSGLYSTDEMPATEDAVVVEHPKATAASQKSLPPAETPKPAPQENNAEEGVFENTELNLKTFFAVCAQCGVPNTKENAPFLRSVFKKCLGQPMSAIGDIVIEAINNYPKK